MLYYNQEKIEQFQKNNTKKSVYILADFDRTITTEDSDNSWGIFNEVLPEKIKKEDAVLAKCYQPMEKAYEVDLNKRKQALDIWYETIVEIYKKEKVKKEIVAKCHYEKLRLREGASALLQYCYAKEIPVVILSAGLGNVIEEFLRQKECYFSNMTILANFLEFDKKTQEVSGIRYNSVIHCLNKDIDKQKEFLPFEIKTKNPILFGDSLHDATMQQQIGNGIRIAFLRQKQAEELEEYRRAFDIVATKNTSYLEITRMLNFM